MDPVERLQYSPTVEEFELLAIEAHPSLLGLPDKTLGTQEPGLRKRIPIMEKGQCRYWQIWRQQLIAPKKMGRRHGYRG